MLTDPLFPPPVTVKATDAENEVTTEQWTFTVPAVSRAFTYDANGNTLTDGQRTMTWDAKNRLKSVTKDGTTWAWDYDYQDRRLREHTNGVLTKQFTWRGTEIVQERDGTGAITRRHSYGGFVDGLVPALAFQTLTDHLGHVREVLTADGTLAAHYDYTPYQGPMKVGTSTVTPTFLTIGGYYHHPGSGLELALYRAYDPELGRWMNPDPIEERADINQYRGVRNNPVSQVDADGLASYAFPSEYAQSSEFRQGFNDGASFGIACGNRIKEEVWAEYGIGAPKHDPTDGSAREAHCIAHCRITRECPGGAVTSWLGGFGKEVLDWGKRRCGSGDGYDSGDMAANARGRQCAKEKRPCTEACKGVR